MDWYVILVTRAVSCVVLFSSCCWFCCCLPVLCLYLFDVSHGVLVFCLLCVELLRLDFNLLVCWLVVFFVVFFFFLNNIKEKTVEVCVCRAKPSCTSSWCPMV